MEFYLGLAVSVKKYLKSTKHQSLHNKQISDRDNEDRRRPDWAEKRNRWPGVRWSGAGAGARGTES